MINGYEYAQNGKKRAVSGKKAINNSEKPDDGIIENDETEYLEELKSWRQRLSEVLQNMDPYGFGRLTQRVLRECGFTQVEVTKNLVMEVLMEQVN